MYCDRAVTPYGGWSDPTDCRKGQTSHTGRSRQQTDDKPILFVSRLEAVKVTIEKKKKCDARALEIVTNLSENTVVEECLLKSVSILAMYNLCFDLPYCILIHNVFFLYPNLRFILKDS